MKNKVCHTFMLAAVLFLTTLTASAQSEHPVTVNVGGGFTPLTGNLSRRLDNGWHFTGGAGYNVHGPFSLGLQFTYNGFGVNRSTLAQAGAPNGDSHVWSLTVDPKMQLPFGSKFKPYVVGGVGYYRRTVNFTQPALRRVTFYDPFFGYLFPGLVPTNQVLATVTRDGIGGNLGAGWEVKLGNSGAHLFTEARYHYAATGSVPTRMVPLTIGVRF